MRYEIRHDGQMTQSSYGSEENEIFLYEILVPKIDDSGYPIPHEVHGRWFHGISTKYYDANVLRSVNKEWFFEEEGIVCRFIPHRIMCSLSCLKQAIVFTQEHYSFNGFNGKIIAYKISHQIIEYDHSF